MSRRLSTIERVNWLIDKEVSISFTIVTRISGELTESVLRRALRYLQEKFPPLKWKIQGGEEPEFVSKGVPQIPLRIVTRRDDNHWREEAEEEMHCFFQWDVGPLLRVVQLVSPDNSINELLLTFCHIGSDATSGIMVLEELLSVTDRIIRGEALPFPSPLPIPLSSIDLLKKDLIFDSPLVGAEERIEPNDTVYLSGDVDVTPEKRITRVIPTLFSKEDTNSLVVRCKKEKTSVHGALCAAFFQEVIAHIRKSENVAIEGPLPISCFTPVDIRRYFINSSPTDIGYFISSALHCQLVDDSASLWETARTIKAAIQSEIKAGKDVEAIRAVGELWKKYDSSLEMLREMNASFPPVAATNLGVLKIPEQYGSLRLETLHYTVAINSATRSGLAFSATTFRGQLALNFHYSEPYISKQRAEIIARRTLERLKDATR